MATEYPTLMPMLSYADARAAIAFLEQAFGFEAGPVLEMPDGRVGHVELRLGGAVVMLADEFPEMGLRSALHADSHYSQLSIEVPDVDAHHERALANGATVANPPEDQFYGDRIYRAVDPEGHRWIFRQHVKDVPEDTWQDLVSNS